IFIGDGGRWDLGLGRPVIRDFVYGGFFAAALIGVADLLILATTSMHHVRGNSFPISEVAAVYLPAAVHEELLFRGYAFQKWFRAQRLSAVIGVSVIFAASHAFNDSVTVLVLTNFFLGGVLLSVVYALYERLWLP